MPSHRNSPQDWPLSLRRHQPLTWNRFWRSLLTLSTAGVGLALLPTAAYAGLARIMTISGTVELRREAWSEFRRANPGTALYGSDWLKPSRGSRILVICPSGSRWLVPAGTESAVHNGCPGTPRVIKPQFGVGDLRGGSDPATPYVISPRLDTVLSPTPTLRWNPVEGAETYRVSLQTRRGPLWEIETDQTTIPYPEDQPPLSPGTLYTLVVETDTGAISTDDLPVLRFNLLTGDRAEAAQTDIAAVEALDLPDMVKALILVEDIYPRYDLTGAAIDVLEEMVAGGCETAKVRRLLGDFYLKSGLRLLAEQNYETALALALATDNLEEQVLAQYGLGTLYARVEEPEKAVEYLEAAQAGALALGDITLADDIAAELP
ncbi:tetratricopeptide repeat protein [Nodosilinea sp. LEGE 06152]|uniref:tetratricopeptide repeat protein n=1 Tax=Nodosilinea sp. LEGE 06152 TaxID=2777966 RepID=UPI00187F6CC1|nr:tetratricopeptide repeat protein [Nodosilinea sp. LEGE 06152]MBE9160625.1 tetratricopeptide repeat protein [Nodosilinea sp. LEGE 06152]